MKLTMLRVTGDTGGALLEQALAHGHAVVAVARRPERVTQQHPHLTVLRGDVSLADTLVTPLTGADAVILCKVHLAG